MGQRVGLVLNNTIAFKCMIHGIKEKGSIVAQAAKSACGE
jgi:hypothetical protein